MLHLLMFMGRVTKQNRKMRQWKGAHKSGTVGRKDCPICRFPVKPQTAGIPAHGTAGRKTAEAGRLQFEAMKKAEKKWGNTLPRWNSQKKNAILRFWQKRRYKQAYAAAKEGKKATEDTIRVTETIAVKAKKVLQEILCRNRAIFAGIGVCVLLFRSDGSLTQQLQRQHSGRQYHNYFYHLCQRG